MIAVGTMTWGREASAAEARRMYALARARGVVWFDTAALYGDGEAERILGAAVVSDPSGDEVQVSSKGGYRGQDIGAEIEASRKRLRLDRIHLYHHHHWQRHGSREAWDGLCNAARRGHIGQIGLSNCAAWQAAQCKPDALQVLYSLAKRGAEVELLPYAAQAGVRVFAYSPLAAGLLTGKYEEPEPLVFGDRTEVPRIRADSRYRARFADWQGLPPGYRTVADVLGMTPAQLAVAWIEAHPANVVPIVGARSAAQLAEVLDRKNLSPAAWRAVGGMFRAPPPPTDRLEESEDR